MAYDLLWQIHHMLLYKSWLAISVVLILAGTAWIATGEGTNPYFAYSLLALLAFGLDLFHAIFRGVELRLRGVGAVAKCFAFGRDLCEFLLNAMNFPIAILQDEKFFDGFEH